jgi:molecular chaperone GrpE
MRDKDMTDTDGPKRPATPADESSMAASPSPVTPKPYISPDTDVGEDPLAEAQRQAADFKDKLLRSLAEMENLRRRTEREVADARAYGIASFARDILGVADNMRRALEAGGTELRASGDPHVVALLDGVELTERELLKALEKSGVTRIEPLGEKFDPHRHQAMYEVADPSAAPGTVAQVVQAGYLIGERVLRPALVAVVKAAPKGSAEASANDDAPAGGR